MPKIASKAPVAKHNVAPAFVQVESVNTEEHKQVQKLIGFLEDKAKTLKSKSLAMLATQLTFGNDPFEKVRQMLADLITKLESDAAADAEQKTYCQSEIDKETTERDQKQEEMESKMASIDATQTVISSLKKDVAELVSNVASLKHSQNEWTVLRADEKARNEKAIVDAQAGDAAVKQAIKIIMDFYGMDLLQHQSSVHKQEPIVDRHGNTIEDLAPDVWSGNYQGKQTESAGIKGLLEIISSDFERTITSTTTLETEAESAYQQDLARVNNEVESKQQIETTKETDLAGSEASLEQFKDDLQDVTLLHTEAIAALDNLKTACMENAASAEERAKAREEEIATLRQASQLLVNIA
jgi:hypothetical protein